MRSCWFAIRTRGAYQWWIVAILAGVCAFVIGDRMFDLIISTGNPARSVAVIELVAVIAAAVGAGLGSPHMWTWEVHGVKTRLKVYAGLTSLFAIGLPVSVVIVAGSMTHVDSQILASAAINATTVGSLCGIVTVFIGPRSGPPASLAAYIGMVLATEMMDIGWLPISSRDTWPAPAIEALVLLTIAVMVGAVTLGRSGRAHRKRWAD